MRLSPSFRITNSITADLTKIERARGFLEAAHLSEQWLAGMQNRALVLEAHHSTHIEGTHLTLDQSEKLLAGERLSGVDPDDRRELLNYRDAFDLVAAYLGSGEPITAGLIREIHKRLVQGVRGDSGAPGEYRRVQNYIAHSITREIIYTPPPALEVPHIMIDLIAWLNASHELTTGTEKHGCCRLVDHCGSCQENYLFAFRESFGGLSWKENRDSIATRIATNHVAPPLRIGIDLAVNSP